MREFQTPDYSGAWFPFEGDRMKFRDQIQAYLRAKTSDSSGTLKVDEDGPHWIGHQKLNLSYSHSENWAVLIYSEKFEVGVDIESKARPFGTSPLAIAKRFFHPSELASLQNLADEKLQSAFLKIWVQKEAFAKLTRKGLSKTIHQNSEQEEMQFSGSVPLSPIGFFTFLLLSPGRTCSPIS